MNTDRVKQEINKIIEQHRSDNPRYARKQYPASKKWLARAEELGILEFIPNAPYSDQPGNTEIQLVIKAAEDAGGAVFNAAGEGEDLPASALYQALHETPEPEDSDDPTDDMTPDEIMEAASYAQLEGEDLDFYIQHGIRNASFDIDGKFDPVACERMLNDFHQKRALGQRILENYKVVHTTWHAAANIVRKNVPDNAIAYRLHEAWQNGIRWLYARCVVPKNDDGLITVAAASEKYNLTPDAVRKACQEQRLASAHKSGGTWLFDAADAEELWGILNTR